VQVSVVQGLPSLQFTTLAVQPSPFTHDIGEQRSVVVQLTGVKRHSPFWESQESSVHVLESLQTTGVYWHPRTASQESVVHAKPSLQLTGVKRQLPPLQESIVQALLSLQFTGVEGTQEPLTGSHW
jgi:hypothetical protein